MDKKVTIKDIAKAAGVSLGSVHLALADKPGVGEKTRKRIKDIARKMHYTPNIMASNLRRDSRSIAVVLPERSKESRFYYDYMKTAAQDFEALADEYNIEIKNYNYTELSETLTNIDVDSVDGLVTVGYPNAKNQSVIRGFTDAGVPVILMDGDLQDVGRTCCVQPDTVCIGRLTGELLLDMIRRPDGKILLCAGNVHYPNHYEIVDALSAYLEESGLHDRLIAEHFDSVDEKEEKRLSSILSKNKIIACCAVNSRSTLVLARALTSAGLGGEIPVIGSGLFDESADYIRDEIITAVIHKRPYEQCHLALTAMLDILVKNTYPSDRVIVSVDTVFRSTLGQYDKVSFRRCN